MMAEDIPQWAGREACKRLGENYGAFAAGRISAGVAKGIRLSAQLIAEHEEPPVDPLLVEAREICAGFKHYEPSHVLSGQLDHSVAMKMVLAALKRGIEIGKSDA